MWYRKNGLVYRKAPYKISNRYTDDRLLDLQQQFALHLNQQWKNNVELIFIDETSCNLWTLSGLKVWQPKDGKLFLPLTKSRGSSASVIGAISNKNSRVLWQVVESSDETSFLNFISYMETEQFFRNGRRVIVVMDNATYHHTNRVKERIRSLGVGILFLPPSSSDLNPIGKS